MKTRAYYKDGLLTIRFDGELDHHSAKPAVRAIEEGIDTHLPKNLILDFNGLSFMDSSGIAVVLKAFRRMNELEGTVSVENVPAQPQKVLDMAGLGRLIKIAAGVKEV
ncbi:MAG: anti-sigma factor antagonist [Oscillospiraceae bacterium]|nr:anti-sigma factor antagonist [Oscillospiraceae bacterium]